MIPYTNRELSWLSFNERVLAESKRPDIPLLERIKFLAISGSNLDEFYQVRIGGHTHDLHSGVTAKDPSGLTISAQLHKMRKRAADMMREQYHHWQETLLPALAAENIQFLNYRDLSAEQEAAIQLQVHTEFLPILTPIALQYEECNVHLPALQLCLICTLRSEEETRQALIPIPRNLPRFIPLEQSPESIHFILLEDILAHSLPTIFPNEEVTEVAVFRLTKNSDIVLADEEARDLAGEMKEVLTKRRFGETVRVEVSSGISDNLKAAIKEQTAAKEEYFIELDGPLGIAEYFSLSNILGFEHLKIKSWNGQKSPSVIEEDSIFDTLDVNSISLFHPYESFDPVVQMIEEAATDEYTLAIKQVLYRTASKSRIIAALIKAALNGKQVTVLIELKARFDEERNLHRAEELRRAGVQVIYGVKGFKTHAKATLIVRKTEQGIRRYVHLGTGNYNETTANIYTDISYLSSNPELGSDTSLFFNMLTGHSKLTRFQKLSPAPTHMKNQLIQLIHAEADFARAGQPACILAKMNSLQDPDVIEALYTASEAGVEIKLNVRGICCLVPGVKGYSENITVVSIIDRFLEHTRAFYFEQAGEKKVFISSADWMVRNLQKRLELMIHIEDAHNQNRIISYLEACFQDNTNAYHLTPDGGFEKRDRGKTSPFRFQRHLYLQALNASKAHEEKSALQFKPHKHQ